MAAFQQPTPTVVYAAHRWVVDGVVLHLQGMLLNADDALFELAARSTDETVQRRCFDLARQLRVQRDQIIGGFRHVMERGRRMWGLRDFRAQEADSAWALAQSLGAKSHVHFGPLLAALCKEFATLLDCNVANFDALPISPTWIANGFLEARRAAGFTSGAADYLDRLFVRYVIDRLGVLYGEVHALLANAGRPATQRVATSGSPLAGPVSAEEEALDALARLVADADEQTLGRAHHSSDWPTQGQAG